MAEKKSIVIDFDGTICEHKFPDIGDLTPGVKEALETLKKAGYKLIIHTCRTASYWKNILPANQTKLVEGFMKYHKLPYDTIWAPDKPIGIAYIDDKAIRFDNNWSEITEQIQNYAKRSDG
jgi:hydroxymethylpyrimidine pyrophosphatase-like HAD family hydrolase